MSGEGRPAGLRASEELRRLIPVGAVLAALAILLLVLTFLPGRSRPPKIVRAPARPRPAVVCASRAVVREAASATSPALTTLSRGAAVTVLAPGLWDRVRDARGEQGYLPAESVELDADRQTRIARADAIFKFSPLAARVTAPTPLRLAPFPFGPVWGEAASGDDLEVFSVDHDYYAVKLPDGTLGFAASADVDLVPTDPSQPPLGTARARVVTGITVSEENPNAATGPAFPTGPPEPAGEGLPVPAPPPGAPYPTAPAVLVERVEPEYPPAALAAHLGGVVVLQVSIDASGDVTKIEPRRTAPLGLTEAAIAAVQRWKYRPATGPQGPIPSIKLVRIEFQPPV